MTIEIAIGGRRFDGWKAMRVRREVRNLAGMLRIDSGDLRSADGDAFPITPGDAFVVSVDDGPFMTGYIDSLEWSYSGFERSMSLLGRSKTSDLVDCSAVIDTGSIRASTVAQIARKVCEPFGIEVQALEPGGPLERFRIEPGETAQDAIQKAALRYGILITTDELGRLVLTRSDRDTETSARIDSSTPVLQASRTADIADRYSSYTVLSQQGGIGIGSQQAAQQTSAVALDDAIKRYRPVIMQSENQAGIDQAKKVARWHRATRRGRSESVEYVLQGTKGVGGKPWRPLDVVRVVDEAMNIDTVLVVESVEVAARSDGVTTRLTLVASDAFTTEPQPAPRTTGDDDALVSKLLRSGTSD